MIDKKLLKSYANKLMFDMNDEEYDTLQNEFSIILKQMDLIGKIENISDVEPMFFPFPNDEATLRDDEVDEINTLTVDEVLDNTKFQAKDQVKVPKVVD